MKRREIIAAALSLPLAGVLPAGQGAAGGTPLRITAFGDSLTAGYGLPAQQGFLAALSHWLTERHPRPVRLLDAGLSGDTTYGGRVRIGWALRSRPDAVMVELGANDMLMGFDPERAADNLDVILRAAGAGGRPVLLIGVGAAGLPGVRAGWDAIWPRLAARHGALLVPDLYAGIRAAPEARRARLLQADGLHPSPAGVARMVAVAGPRALELARAAEAWPAGVVRARP